MTNKSLPLEKKLLGTCAICKKQLVFELKGSLIIPNDCVVMGTGVNITIAHQKCAAKHGKEKQKKDLNMFG